MDVARDVTIESVCHLIEAAVRGSQGTTVVAIAGHSAGGKTHTAHRIKEWFAGDCVLVPQDDLILPEEERRTGALFEKFPIQPLSAIVDQLVGGRATIMPTFDQSLRRRGPARVVRTARLIVVEGVLVLHSTLVRRRAALSFFVTSPADVRLERQLTRAEVEGRYPDLTPEQRRARFAAKAVSEDFHVSRQTSFCDWLLDTSEGTLAPLPRRGQARRSAA